MDKRILLIGARKSFMMNAIMKGLQNEDYEVIMEEPDVTTISRIEEKPQIWLIFIEEHGELPPEMLIFLRDYFVDSEDEQETLLYLIGNDEEFRKVYKLIPEKFITGVFERPLNVQAVADKLEVALKKRAFHEERKKILVVDDDATMLRTIKTWLSERYNVFMANSGMSAITLLGRQKVDLILLDYEMPVANGPQVLEMLRSDEHTRNIPVMFLTANSTREGVTSVLHLKPEKYLLKTMSHFELMDEVNDFFAERE
ncbi:MAG: response regulator [Lachnospiraceae bacterium]|nr:response regulator [Lachnospiraceae bacterium]